MKLVRRFRDIDQLTVSACGVAFTFVSAEPGRSVAKMDNEAMKQ
jgi:hypothetical protein